jgi:hypothetical protein
MVHVALSWPEAKTLAQGAHTFLNDALHCCRVFRSSIGSCAHCAIADPVATITIAKIANANFVFIFVSPMPRSMSQGFPDRPVAGHFVANVFYFIPAL